MIGQIRERVLLDLLMTSRCDRNFAQSERNWFMCLIDGEFAL
jgi:hypothetical protein